METQEKKELSTEELRALLAKREREEKEARLKEKESYEQERDEVVLSLIKIAADISTGLQKFKAELHGVFEEYQEKLNNYGEIRSNSKGGFSITTKDGLYRVRRTRNTMPTWDERSSKALELIADFLRDTVKKRDRKLFEILISFIQRNEKGELEYSKVMHLLQHRDKYNDVRWVEGLKLIEESYSNQLRGYGYEFFQKDETTGKFQKIEINFTAL